MDSGSFKDRLQLLIDLKKISQADLAKGIGVQAARITGWLKGDPQNPQRKSIAIVASYFGCSIDWLQKGVDEPFPENVTQAGGDISTRTINLGDGVVQTGGDASGVEISVNGAGKPEQTKQG